MSEEYVGTGTFVTCNGCAGKGWSYTDPFQSGEASYTPGYARPPLVCPACKGTGRREIMRRAEGGPA
jgi:hypothetical protein